LAKELQLKPEDIGNEVFLSRDNYGNTSWHKAAEIRKVEILEKLWNWAKETQLKPDEIRNVVLSSKTRIRKRPGTRQQKMAKLKF